MRDIVFIGPLQIKVTVTEEDLEHAMLHGEVTLSKIEECLTFPDYVVKSRFSQNACLFYKIKKGKHYFVCVVEILKNGKALLRTAYESTRIKEGKVLYKKKVQ